MRWHCSLPATLAAAGAAEARGGGNSNSSGSTSISITIPKAPSASSDINLLGEFYPSETSDFLYEIYFENDSYKSDHKTAKAEGKVTFDKVPYDTYTFYLKIWVDERQVTELDTIPKVATVSATDNTVTFSDLKTSSYSQWFFVKNAAGLFDAISRIEAGGYTAEKKAKLCLLNNIKASDSVLSVIAGKYELKYNDFNITEDLFSVSIPEFTGGSITAIPTDAATGEKVTLTVTPATGMKLYSISVGGNDATAGINTTTVTEGTKYEFTMPAYNVNVNAVFKRYYMVTFQDHNENTVDTREFYEGDSYDLYNIKNAITPPDGRTIVAFKDTETGTIYGESSFAMTFSSENFTPGDVTLRACLDFTYTNDTNYGYEIAPNTFDTQKGTSANPYMMNLYGADTRKQIKITISDYACADPDTGLSITVGGVLSSPFDIEHTGAVFVVKILPTLKTRIPLATLTVTDSATGATKDIYVTVKDNKIGTNLPGSTLAVGDIVFNDGSSVTYSDDLALTEEQKAAAVAVIFDASNKKGVGLQQGTGKAWCTSDATAYNVTTYATSTTDGSENMASIKGVSDWGTDGAKYPAFSYADSYSATGFTSGWYLPAKDELETLYNNITAVNSALTNIGATQLNTSSSSYYRSSSQYAGDAICTWVVGFGAGDLINDGSKYYGDGFSVCVIRKF